ncbi:S-layer homology domain-containing protein [Oscillibacter sp.]|uniref:S-layer homology domain-containing protein n=1 Tax=Oscillibacter sp. TaxID=1945593 RepID=UPI00262158E4|nr:S-layer homology domain-containing protein [Oscillibacter sp.]MDD3347208.1 S-layer homology domain-containing protein [Oscillibacter sp.]
MKRIWKQASAMLLSCVLAVGWNVPVRAAATERDVAAAAARSAAYMLEQVKAPQVGTVGGEWAIIGLTRGDFEVSQDYIQQYQGAVERYVKERNGILHGRKYTEYSRVALALTAIGADPADVAGYNLLEPLGDFEKTVWQGVNGPAWALIALDSGNYAMPECPGASTQATRQMYVEELLGRQLEDGGWSLSNEGGADPDMTGMVLQALSNYQTQETVKAATEKAVDCLSRIQNPDGGFSCRGEDTVEGCAQVLVALCTLGISVEDARFMKNGNSPLDSLLRYQNGDGSFSHSSGDAQGDQMASEQGLYALVAVLRSEANRPGLYDMRDVAADPAPEGVGLAGKNAAVKKLEVTHPGITFDDVQGHANQEAVEAMAARGVINGRSDGRFDPDAPVTRGEFAVMMVRALGLSPVSRGEFSDIPSGSWLAAQVDTASAYGIVNGVGGGRFEPNGEITRQQAAVMTARAAKLCGMDTEVTDQQIQTALAPFADDAQIPAWSRPGVAFCYREGILDQTDGSVEPTRAILRGEVAQILYNLLGRSALL